MTSYDFSSDNLMPCELQHPPADRIEYTFIPNAGHCLVRHYNNGSGLKCNIKIFYFLYLYHSGCARKAIISAREKYLQLISG